MVKWATGRKMGRRFYLSQGSLAGGCPLVATSCDGLSLLRHGYGGVDDQLPGYPELVARLEQLLQD